MARLKRFVVPRTAHHVLQRTVSGSAAFTDAADHIAYLSALRSCSLEHRVSVLAYALMAHQVHLVVVPDEAQSLGRMMQGVTRQYVGPYNRKHGRSGALWQGRFASAPVQSETDLLACALYVEQAPQRAAALSSACEYPWSSAAHHAGLRTDAWLAAMPAGSGYWKLGNTPFERDAAYRQLLDQPQNDAQRQRIEAVVLKGWALGSASFVEEVGALAGRRPAPKPRGRPRMGQKAAREG